jgi:simple sugar transport system permease protein
LYISLALIPAWAPGLTAGSGWIALALVILGSWRPWRVLLAAYLFGAATRLVIVVSISARAGAGSPKSLGLPYTRGD